MHSFQLSCRTTQLLPLDEGKYKLENNLLIYNEIHTLQWEPFLLNRNYFWFWSLRDNQRLFSSKTNKNSSTPFLLNWKEWIFCTPSIRVAEPTQTCCHLYISSMAVTFDQSFPVFVQMKQSCKEKSKLYGKRKISLMYAISGWV